MPVFSFSTATRFFGIAASFLLSLCLLPSSSAWAQASDGLVAHYPLDGNAEDASGNGLTGTIYGATPTEDRFDEPDAAMRFSGNSRIDVNTNISLSSITITAWVNGAVFDGTRTRSYEIVTINDNGTRNSLDFHELYDGGSSGNSSPRWEWGGSTIASESEISTNEWHFIAGTFDESTGFKKLYVDGIEVASGIGSGTILGTLLTIGGPRTVQGSARGWNGTIDDVRIYNRTLSQSELCELWGEDCGLIAHYEFEENLLDSAGNRPGTGYGGFTYNEGVIGSALDLNGVDSYVALPQELPVLEETTIAAWINFRSDSRMVLYGADCGPNQDAGMHIRVNYWSQGTSPGAAGAIVGLADDCSSTSGKVFAERDNVIAPDNWHHVAHVYKAGELLALYIDGIPQATVTSGIPQDYLSLPSYIGTDGRSPVGNYNFDGLIDEVRIYDRALSEQEIRELNREDIDVPTILELDDDFFGEGSLTRDIKQGLDFLDVLITQPYSYDDIISQLGVEGIYAGYRYAIREEVENLVSNWKIYSGRPANGNQDWASGLVDLLGPTSLGSIRETWGFTQATDLGRPPIPQDRVPGIRIMDYPETPANADQIRYQTLPRAHTGLAGHFLVSDIYQTIYKEIVATYSYPLLANSDLTPEEKVKASITEQCIEEEKCIVTIIRKEISETTCAGETEEDKESCIDECMADWTCTPYSDKRRLEKKLAENVTQTSDSILDSGVIEFSGEIAQQVVEFVGSSNAWVFGKLAQIFERKIKEFKYYGDCGLSCDDDQDCLMSCTPNSPAAGGFDFGEPRDVVGFTLDFRVSGLADFDKILFLADDYVVFAAYGSILDDKDWYSYTFNFLEVGINPRQIVFYIDSDNPEARLDVDNVVLAVDQSAINQSPIASCKDIAVLADAQCLGSGSVNNGSYDPDGDPIEISVTPPGSYGLGDTLVTLTVTDDFGASDSCTGTVAVGDTTPPSIQVSLSPDMLWPPNHKMRDIEAMVTVSDTCDANPGVALTSLESNEPDNVKGDGNTVDDIQEADIGTDDRSFKLRAERFGKGDGRVYTTTYTATDSAGNAASASATVTVPHHKGKKPHHKGKKPHHKGKKPHHKGKKM